MILCLGTGANSRLLQPVPKHKYFACELRERGLTLDKPKRVLMSSLWIPPMRSVLPRCGLLASSSGERKVAMGAWPTISHLQKHDYVSSPPEGFPGNFCLCVCMCVLVLMGVKKTCPLAKYPLQWCSLKKFSIIKATWQIAFGNYKNLQNHKAETSTMRTEIISSHGCPMCFGLFLRLWDQASFYLSYMGILS